MVKLDKDRHVIDAVDAVEQDSRIVPVPVLDPSQEWRKQEARLLDTIRALREQVGGFSSAKIESVSEPEHGQDTHANH